MLPDFFTDALRDLLTYMLTNTPLPPSEDGNATMPECTFPHPDLANLSLQHPNPVVIAGPPSSYAEGFGALDVLGFLDRYEAQVTMCVNSMIDKKIQETCPATWDSQILPDLRTWLTDQVVPWMARPYARGLANRELSQGIVQICYSHVLLATEGRLVVAGVITRFEYHLCKTICELRYVGW
jgi:anaphase-promoting complex subunit 2